MQNQQIKITIDTLGCAKNQVDSTTMLSLLNDSGFKIVDEVCDCDVLILNTCAFIQAATKEGIDTFFEYRNAYPDIKIIVSGCMPSRYKDELTKALSEADYFVECKDEDKIVDVVNSLFENTKDKDALSWNYKSELSLYDSSYAYVKISDGCNRRCSYCTIPSIRGKYQSTSIDEIFNDIDKIVKSNDSGLSNVSEIVLVAQDCGAWGKDFSEKSSLANLLQILSEKYPQLLFRVLYIQPDAVNDELLEVVGSHKNIANYFDVPIQHCSEHILREMKRLGNYESLVEKFKQIRKRVPEATLRTTLIAGFPGESEDDFAMMCEFLEEVRLDYCGVFGFSSEEGTVADKLDNKVDADTIEERVSTIRDICDRISTEKLEDRVGDTYSVNIEGQEEGRYFGRAEFQAPDVDGFVYIQNSDKEIQIGDVVNVEIIDTEFYDLVGKLS